MAMNAAAAHEMIHLLHHTLAERASQVAPNDPNWELGVYRSLLFEILTEKWPVIESPSGKVLYDTPEKATRFLLDMIHKEVIAAKG